MTQQLLTIGECMVELRQAGDGLLRQGFGGDTFNTAYYARIGLPETWEVEFFSGFGTDRMSQEMIAFMTECGVGTSASPRIGDRQPGLYMIHLSHGERSFSYWRATSAARRLASDRMRLRAAIEASSVILFSGVTLAILEDDGVDVLLDELRRARQAGKVIAFDPNIRPRLWQSAGIMRETLTRGASVASILMPSFDDEATHFGDETPQHSIERYHALGVADVILKDGARGALISTPAVRTQVPAQTVEKIADTTGAGDSFNGAFLSHYAMNSDVVAAAVHAARVAATVIGHHGALVERQWLQPVYSAS